MPKNTHPIEQEELMAYLDGELPVDRAAAAAAHLENCRECQELAADLQSVSRRMMAWQVEPADLQLKQDIVTALQEPKQIRAPRRRVSKWIWGFAGTGAVVLSACVMVALLVQPRYKRPPAAASFVKTRPVAAMIASEPMIARTAQLILTTTDFDKTRPRRHTQASPRLLR
jgi:anti-sigma factor RsiW